MKHNVIKMLLEENNKIKYFIIHLHTHLIIIIHSNPLELKTELTNEEFVE